MGEIYFNPPIITIFHHKVTLLRRLAAKKAELRKTKFSACMIHAWERRLSVWDSMHLFFKMSSFHRDTFLSCTLLQGIFLWQALTFRAALTLMLVNLTILFLTIQPQKTQKKKNGIFSPSYHSTTQQRQNIEPPSWKQHVHLRTLNYWVTMLHP